MDTNKPSRLPTKLQKDVTFLFFVCVTGRIKKKKQTHTVIPHDSSKPLKVDPISHFIRVGGFFYY